MTNLNDLKDILKYGLDELKINAQPLFLEKIISYIELLVKWNKIYSLTAICDPKEIVVRHLLDSLSILPFIKGDEILDFGSGAGLPGIPLAIFLPQYNFTLLDSASKKTTFLNHVVLTLKLNNVKVITSRAEDFYPAIKFNQVITRATTKIWTIFEQTSHLLAHNGELLVMKGKNPAEELKEVKKTFKVERIVVPYLQEERHLVTILV